MAWRVYLLRAQKQELPKPFGWRRLTRVWSRCRAQLPVAVTQHHAWVRLSVLVLLVVCLAMATRLKFDSSLEIWFLEDDPNIVNYRRFQNLFGRDEIVIIGLESQKLFSPATLDQLARCTQELQDLPLVRRALSLTSVDTLADVDGQLQLQPLLPAARIDTEAADELQRRVAANPLVRRTLLSQDARATAIILALEQQCVDAEQHIMLAEQVRQIMAELSPYGKTYLTGIPIVNDVMFRFARRDLLQLSPVVLLMVWGTSWFLFRNLWLSLLPLVVVGIATSVVFGLAGFLGWRRQFSGLCVDPGLDRRGRVEFHPYHFGLVRRTSCRQIVNDRYGRRRAADVAALLDDQLFDLRGISLTDDQRHPADSAVRHSGGCGNRGGLPDQYRLPAGSAVPAQTSTTSVFPALRCGIPRNGFGRAGRLSRRSSLAVVITALLLLPPAMWGISLVETTANPLNYFRRMERIRQDTEAVDRLFGGSCSVEFLVESADGGLSRRELLQQMEDFQGWIEQNLAVSQVFSIVDYLKEANRVREQRAVGRLPARQIYLLLLRIKRISPEILLNWLDETFSQGRISARLCLSQADRLAVQVPLLESELAKRFQQADVRVQTTGYVKLINNMRTYLLTSQIRSLSMAAAGVTLMMCCLLGSLRLGLLSMIPNLIPVLMGIALMGFAGIRLDPGTVMIGSVALGLVVDDTCHFLSHYRRERRRGSRAEQAVRWSISHTGRPIILTSIILTLGFLALAAGSFAPSIYFGVVTAAIIGLALLADLLLMPAILLLLGDRAP